MAASAWNLLEEIVEFDLESKRRTPGARAEDSDDAQVEEVHASEDETALLKSLENLLQVLQALLHVSSCLHLPTHTHTVTVWVSQKDCLGV